MIPLSLYIHIPWCEKKCPYCDFNSHQRKSDIDQPTYVAALIADLEDDLQRLDDAARSRPVTSIFIGGGTPSLFSGDSIAQLLEAVNNRVELCDDCEITMEANPGSSEAGKFIAFRQAGVNRLSIGVQSFNVNHLNSLGRVHDTKQAVNAARTAKRAGFDNFNLDLMFGLPQQTLEECLQDIASAIELQPSHISCYQLTIEPNTLFHHQPPALPEDETLWSMQCALQDRLADADYRQYEVSAYAKPGRQCRHNLNYWQFGDYLGIGAGAHGKITAASGVINRYWKIKHPASYLRAAEQRRGMLGGSNEVAQNQLAFEFMMNALRLTDGAERHLFSQRTGIANCAINDILDKHQQQGLVALSNEMVVPTARGRQFLDTMLQDYLPD